MKSYFAVANSQRRNVLWVELVKPFKFKLQTARILKCQNRSNPTSVRRGGLRRASPLNFMTLDSRYDHEKTEPEIYKRWEESGYFNPDNLPPPARKASGPGGQPFTIIMPPPNANGHLHAGHALFVTLEDIMTRYKRMRGYRTLWLPGADHAGFETQVVYEHKLEKEGRSRFQMSHEELYREIMEFTLENKKHMEQELRSLGASCDWSREKFTLDSDIVLKVQKMFAKMHKEGLIYRGNRIVSWCPKHQTSFSDLEIEDVERTDPFYYLKYGPFTIATARPETKFGDKYVVMHPDDKRYAEYKDGLKIELEWINGPITATVVKDTAVDMEFGTGAMTITPWHDAADFDIAERHNLDKEQIIDFQGKLLPIAGEFAGMSIKDARPKIVDRLREKGLLARVDEKYTHTVRVCYKCSTAIEPQIKEQWFVKTKPLAEKAISAIKEGKIKFIPDHYEKICLHWLENIIDWNISRQIAWGIRIPAWFCLKCKAVRIGATVKARWFLVRHGETDWNKYGKAQGQADIPLNETGIAQAKKAAEQLKNKNIDLIISSDLKRAQMTAEIIAQETGAEVIFDKNLRERFYGKAEGLSSEDIRSTFKDFYEYEGKSAGHESYEEIEERIWQTFKNHRKSHEHKNVVIVGHGGSLRMLLKRIRDLGFAEVIIRGTLPNATPIPVDILNPCENCGGDLFEQDPDVFDTWFSSGQWPFLALGYPDSKDFKTFYPTDVMETAGEIIFFWVTRMIMFSLYVTGQVPFQRVYLHGLVMDAKGRKMSKSIGNVINPLEITAKYGTDALRMALVVGNTPGTSLALSEDRVRGYRNFTTKIWNIARFILLNKPTDSAKQKESPLGDDDARAIEECETVKKEVTKYLDSFEFHLAAEKIYHYVWHTLADKVIESAKARLQNGTSEEKLAAYHVLQTIFTDSLKLLHPFMPFITEELYQKFKPGRLLMIERW